MQKVFHLKTKTIKIVIFLLFLFCIYIGSHITIEYLLFIKCPFYKFLHIYCPGCGITRMFVKIFNLKFYAAFRYNPLVFILFMAFSLYYILNIFFKFNISERTKKIFFIILLFIVILYGVFRNVSYFSFLQPTEI